MLNNVFNIVVVEDKIRIYSSKTLHLPGSWCIIFEYYLTKILEVSDTHDRSVTMCVFYDKIVSRGLFFGARESIELSDNYGFRCTADANNETGII